MNIFEGLILGQSMIIEATPIRRVKNRVQWGTAKPVPLAMQKHEENRENKVNVGWTCLEKKRHNDKSSN